MMIFKEVRVGGEDAAWANMYNSDEPHQTPISPHKNEEGNADGEQQVGENAHGLKRLPFEFVALETCLEAACTSLDNEVRISYTFHE